MTPARLRLMTVLTLLATFAAGALVGAAITRAADDDRIPRRHARMGREGRPPGPPPIFAEGSPVAERLGLSAAQRDSITRIVRRDRAKADSLYRQMRPRLRARYDSTTQAIEAVLTPEQRTEWRRMRERWRERDGRREERRARRRERAGLPTTPADSAR